MQRVVAVVVGLYAFVVSPSPLLAQTDLVAAIATQAGITATEADQVLGAFANAVSKGLKKGDRISLVGFGSFSVAKRALGGGSGAVPPLQATGKALKLAFRDGSKTAGVLTPTVAYWNVAIGLDRSFIDDPIEIEGALPKPFDTKLLQLEIGLPSSAPGTTFRAMLDSLTADEGLVVEINLPRDAFDDFVYDELNPGPDFVASFFSSFHAGGSSDPTAQALLSERIGFGGVDLCADGVGCPLPPSDLAALKADIAAALGVANDVVSHGVDAILALPVPGPLSDATSSSGVGTFAVAKRAARVGRNPQTGKTIKIAAKKVVKFKAGSELARSN